MKQRNKGKRPTRGKAHEASKLFGKRIEYPDPLQDQPPPDEFGQPQPRPTTTGMVIGYDPRPWGKPDGHWLAVSRDDDHTARDYVEFGTETVIG